MKKKQLPSKREIIPTSAEPVPKQRAVFTDEFKRMAVSRLHDGKQSATALARNLACVVISSTNGLSNLKSSRREVHCGRQVVLRSVN